MDWRSPHVGPCTAIRASRPGMPPPTAAAPVAFPNAATADSRPIRARTRSWGGRLLRGQAAPPPFTAASTYRTVAAASASSPNRTIAPAVRRSSSRRATCAHPWAAALKPLTATARSRAAA